MREIMLACGCQVLQHSDGRQCFPACEEARRLGEQIDRARRAYQQTCDIAPVTVLARLEEYRQVVAALEAHFTEVSHVA